jgi:hypothetical protein
LGRLLCGSCALRSRYRLVDFLLEQGEQVTILNRGSRSDDWGERVRRIRLGYNTWGNGILLISDWEISNTFRICAAISSPFCHHLASVTEAISAKENVSLRARLIPSDRSTSR